MLTFDEASLKRVLNQLSVWKRVAFAAMCAERLRPAYLAFSRRTGRGDPREFDELMNCLWSDLDGRRMSDHEVEASIERCMNLTPGEDDETWDESQVYAENAGTALVYALRCRRNGDSQDAAWAARHVYEALDYYIREHGHVELSPHDLDIGVMLHPLMQRELMRQQRDVDRIRLARDDVSEAVAVLRPLARRASERLFGTSPESPE